jgi:HTH-type transcriptional regulator/antitoxin HipB
MKYPVDNQTQLRAVLRALRQIRDLSQAGLGQAVGVNQKRIARIETAPGVTSFDQISRIVTALGGRMVIEAGGDLATKPRDTKTKRPSQLQANW